MRYAGSPLRSLQPPPGLGEHTDSVLRELCGVSAEEVTKLRQDGVVL